MGVEFPAEPRCGPEHGKGKGFQVLFNIAPSSNVYNSSDAAMAGNTPVVSTGTKDFGTISGNQGAVIGDVSGYAKVIGLRPVHIDIDLMLNPD